jgi:hypothetical protein
MDFDDARYFWNEVVLRYLSHSSKGVSSPSQYSHVSGLVLVLMDVLANLEAIYITTGLAATKPRIEHTCWPLFLCVQGDVWSLQQISPDTRNNKLIADVL